MLEIALEGYAAVSDQWIERSEAIPAERMLQPVLDLLPRPPGRAVDIGAGSGRDAAWLAAQGNRVTAIEPVARLRCAGIELHGALPIEWLDDRLPELTAVPAGSKFVLLLVNGVWQHLDASQQRTAMRRLAELAHEGATLIVSLRHGPGAATRPVHEIDASDTIRTARDAGFELIRERQAESWQDANRAAGVYWTWLALRRV